MRPIVFAFPLLLTAVTAAARADTGADFEEAKRRMAEGKALFAKGRFEESRVLYEKACAVVHTDNCIRSLALAELRAGKPLDSYRHWKAYFASPTAFAKIDAAGRRELEGFKKEAYDLTGHIQIETTVNARIVVDGSDVGTAPLDDTVDVMPGEHAVEASLGERKAKKQITAPAGQLVRATIAFDVQVAPTGPATSEPAAPPQPPSAPPDIKPVTSPSGGHVSTTGTVVRWSLTGAAAVGLGLGFTFGAMSQSKASDVDAYRASHPSPCAPGSTACAGYSSLQDSQRTDYTLSLVFLVVGGVLAAGALAAWLWWPPQKDVEKRSTWIAPRVQGGGFGVDFGGAF